MRRISLLALALGLMLAAGAPPARATPPLDDRLCFAETGQCVAGRFRAYWEQNGGLPVFGLPLTAAGDQLNRDTNQTYLTQVFERARFELHPEAAAPYDVQLGRLGDDQLVGRGVDWRSATPRPGSPPGAAADSCLAFDTGHAVCDFGRDEAAGRARTGFRSFWESHGLLDPKLDSYGRSLALFGKPLTSPRFEINSSGDYVLAQQFERARFEWSFERNALTLGRLGYELHSNAYALTPVVWSGASPARFDADAAGLVWADAAQNQAGAERHTLRAAGPDGAPLGAFGVAQGQMVAMGLDQRYVYWIGDGALWRLARAGGEPEILAKDPGAPLKLAVDAEGAYWANAGGEIKALGKAGGPARIIASGQGQVLALAADKSFVYWATAAGEVKRAPKEGGAAQALLKDLGAPRQAHLALGPSQLIVAYETRGPDQPSVIVVAAKDGAARRELAPNRPPLGLAATDAGLFWSDMTGQISYAPFDTLAPRVVVTGQDFPAGLRATARSLHWANRSGSIVRADFDK
ncbi:MAG TPA: hypothetical protein VGE07_02605 [Herpetosiphonaceae bacterium]